MLVLVLPLLFFAGARLCGSGALLPVAVEAIKYLLVAAVSCCSLIDYDHVQTL
jgi:hypothetical protein